MVNIQDDLLRKIGERYIQIIVERTLKGDDKNGDPFPPYSGHPFKMPSGAIGKTVRKVMYRAGQLSYFRNNNKALWVVINGGYRDLKKMIFRNAGYDGTVNLWLSGNMLGSLRVISADNNLVKIGFTRDEEARKAEWNADKGREFMGLTPAELNDEEITNLILMGLVINT
jgi:hypothetical protein